MFGSVFYFRQVPIISEVKTVEMLEVSCLLSFSPLLLSLSP
jgi:hypothetical protein